MVNEMVAHYQQQPAKYTTQLIRQKAPDRNGRVRRPDFLKTCNRSVFSVPMNRGSSGRWNHRLTLRRVTILPLPKEEGRGEGEQVPAMWNIVLPPRFKGFMREFLIRGNLPLNLNRAGSGVLRRPQKNHGVPATH
jgi:hypothetical protein